MTAHLRQTAALALLVAAAIGSIATSAPETNPELSGSAVAPAVHLRLDPGASVAFEVTAELTLPAEAQGLELLSVLHVNAVSEDEAGGGHLEIFACDDEEELMFGDWTSPDSVYLELDGGLDACEPGSACVVEICGLVTATDAGAKFALNASASLSSSEMMPTGEAGETFEIALDLVVDIPSDPQ